MRGLKSLAIGVALGGLLMMQSAASGAVRSDDVPDALASRFFDVAQTDGVHEISLTKQVVGETERVFALAAVSFLDVVTAWPSDATPPSVTSSWLRSLSGEPDADG